MTSGQTFPKNFEDLFSENTRIQKKSQKLQQTVSELEELKRDYALEVQAQLNKIQSAVAELARVSSAKEERARRS